MHKAEIPVKTAWAHEKSNTRKDYRAAFATASVVMKKKNNHELFHRACPSSYGYVRHKDEGGQKEKDGPEVVSSTLRGEGK